MLSTTGTMLEIRRLYRENFHISDENLPFVQWSSVVRKVIEYQQKTNFCRVKRNLTALDIAMRVNRVDNYIAAFMQHKVLSLEVRVPFVGRRVLFNRYIEHVVRSSVFSWCEQETLDEERFMSAARLRITFFVYALMSLVVAPPFILLNVMLALFKYTENSRSSSPAAGSLSAISWSNYTNWKVREYNEYPHSLANRMSRAITHMQGFLASLESKKRRLVRRFVSYVLSCVLALLLAISFVNDELLLNLEFFGKRLYWYTLVLGFALTWLSERHVASSSEQERGHESYFSGIQRETHYSVFKSPGEAFEKYKNYVRSRGALVVEEVSSYVLTPLFLLFVFIPSIPRIIDFVRKNTVRVEGVGDVCVYSTFDLRNFGSLRVDDEEEEKEEGEEHDDLLFGFSVYALDPKCKMEKSYFSFMAEMGQR